MYGHIERPAHWVHHMALLRDVQKDTGGFTEFVPLSLIHQEAPMYQRGLVKGVRPGATGAEVVRMHALARLMLGPTFRNIQSSWVKEGPKLSQLLLQAGANDLGGTLINESISTSAGAAYGQLVPPTELRRLVRDLGRVPAQRDTTYGIVKLYAVEPDGESDPLADIQDPDARFGSYRRLIASGEFRFAHPSAAGVSSPSSPAETTHVTCTAAPATAPPVLGGAAKNS
jgi:FO synthase subunit 2